MEKIKLNNEIVFMRKYVKQAKVHVINKLVKQIKFLQNRKGNEVQVKKAKRKAERFLETVALMKKIKPDDVSKLALSKAKDWKDVLQQKNSTLQDRCIAMLANYGAVQKEVEAFYNANKELVLKISDYFAQWEEKNKLSKDSPKTNKMLTEKKSSKNIQKVNLINEDLLSSKKNNFKSVMQTENESVTGENDTPFKMSLEDEKIHLGAKDCDSDDNDGSVEKIAVIQNLSNHKNPLRNIAEIKELHSSENNSMEVEELDSNEEESESDKNDEDTSIEEEEMSDNSLIGDNKKAGNEESIKKVFQSVTKSDLLPKIDNIAKNKIKAIALLNLNELEGLDEIPIDSSFGNDDEGEKESSEDEINETSENKNTDPFFLGHSKEDSMQINSTDPFFVGYNNEGSNAKELDISSEDNTDSFIRTKDSAHSFRSRTQNVKNSFHKRDDRFNPKDSFQKTSYSHRNVSKQFKIEESSKQPFKTNKFTSKNYHNKFQENNTSKIKKDFQFRNAPFSPRDVYDKKQFKNISKGYGNKDDIPLKNKMMYKKGNASECLHPSWEAKKKQKELLSTSFQGKRMVFND